MKQTKNEELKTVESGQTLDDEIPFCVSPTDYVDRATVCEYIMKNFGVIALKNCKVGGRQVIAMAVMKNDMLFTVMV